MECSRCHGKKSSSDFPARIVGCHPGSTQQKLDSLMPMPDASMSSLQMIMPAPALRRAPAHCLLDLPGQSLAQRQDLVRLVMGQC